MERNIAISDSPSNFIATKEVTVIAPINIAIIKYWGKRDEDLVLPLNDSISVNINELYAKTRVRVGPQIEKDTVSINGKVVDLSKLNRFRRCFAEIRRMYRKRTMEDSEDNKKNFGCFDKFEVVSTTNFPTDAGLASSAAGFAAIAFAMGRLYNLSKDEIERIARLGSGSSCRSLLGGFVHWKAGTCADGSDCCCEVVAPTEHWSTLRAMILVTSNNSKDVGSTDGMRKSTQTSELLSHRVKEVVPKRVSRLLEAIKSRNFEDFATITMAESNQLHAICMDTMPPLRYMNKNSWHLLRIMEALNTSIGSKCVAYTFDAGPNCCLFFERDSMLRVLTALLKYCRLSTSLIDKVATSVAEEWLDLRNEVVALQDSITLEGVEQMEHVVEDVILSHVGAEPRVI
uniref:Diphosphomevalonate decarboxylase n=1 Tax=Ascaris suum TaxID=6253 RepID=F1L5Y1_ASCSU